jgi:urease accessory protein UreF
MASISVTLEQLIAAVQQLQPDEQAQLAKALVQAGLHSDLKALIQELYALPPADDISDADIMAEIKAVRQESR